MRSKKAIANFKVDLLITIIIIALGFISRSIFIEYMGSKMTGLMLLFTQLMAYLNLAELGVGVAAASLMYKPLADNDEDKIRVLYKTLTKIYRFVSIAVIILGLLLGLGVFFYVAAVSDIKDSFIYWILFVLNTAFTYLYGQNSTLLTASQNYSAVRLIQGGGKIVTICFQLLFIMKYDNFFYYLLIDSLCVIVQSMIFNAKIKKTFPWLEQQYSNKSGSNDYCNSRIKVESSITKELIRKIKLMFFHKIGGVLVFNTDYILVSRFLSLTYISIYASYMMVFQAVTLFMNVLTNSTTAGVGDYFVNSNDSEKESLFRMFYSLFICLATCICISIYCLIDSFIINWLGQSYVLPQQVVLLMLANVYISILRIPCDIFKNATGVFNDIHFPLLEGGINLVVSYILIQHIGLSGIIIGTLVSNVLIIAIGRPVFLIDTVFKNKCKWRFFIKLHLYPLCLSIFCFFMFHVLLKMFPLSQSMNSWSSWLTVSPMVIAVTMAITLSVFMIEPNIRKGVSFFMKYYNK